MNKSYIDPWITTICSSDVCPGPAETNPPKPQQLRKEASLGMVRGVPPAQGEMLGPAALRRVRETQLGLFFRTYRPQVKKLLEKIESYEGQRAQRPDGETTIPEASSQSRSQPISADPLPSPESAGLGFRAADLIQLQEPETPGTGLGNNRPSSLAYNDSISSASPATDLASGPTFVAQVRSLLDRSKKQVPSPTGMGSQTQADARSRSFERPLNSSNDSSMLSLEESQHLLDQFLFYLGVSQHFFDPRSFSDSMILLFQSREGQEKQKQTTWYTEYLLVMAMAKLMDVKQPTSQPPGSSLFAEALDQLPALHQLSSGGGSYD
ncbi:unnamed protein product [Penicillium discolor]